MVRHRSEGTQPGNPHRLTLRQHVLPSKTIARFCDADGRVSAHLVESGRELRLKPQDQLFWVKRVWDQRAESVLGKNIEDKFQAIAEQLSEGSLLTLEQEMHEAVTEMYLLWRYRFLAAREPREDMVVNGIRGEELTIDEQERLESRATAFVRADGSMSGRTMTGLGIQMAMMSDWANGAERMRWGVLRAVAGLEFVVPDAFIDQPLVPVSPNVYLVSGVRDAHAGLETVADINRAALGAAGRYWFCRRPDRAPAFLRTIPWSK